MPTTRSSQQDIWSSAGDGLSEGDNWLGLKNSPSDVDEVRAYQQKSEPAVNTLAKKILTTPIPETHPLVVKPSKDSAIDNYLKEDRLTLTETKNITPAAKKSVFPGSIRPTTDSSYGVTGSK